VKNNRIDANQLFRPKEFMITATQCRAARGLLDWTQQELADVARIGVATVRQFEGGGAETRQATLAVLKWALETAGIEFIDENGGGPGVRLRKRLTKKS
jgi:transcriptional regulator with XRE-family HTH domain